jgi:hypothetical protein
MVRRAERSDRKLWEKGKRQVTAGEKGGRSAGTSRAARA